MNAGPQGSKDAELDYVGDAFWLKHASQLIAGTHAGITRQAERLSVSIAWFWTAYLAFIGIRPASGGDIAFVEAAPCAVLIFAYVGATIAQGPARGTFDPRAPDEIVMEHNSSTARRLAALRVAYGLVIASGLFIGFAILAR